jgi:beta-1,4-mannosyltransferase
MLKKKQENQPKRRLRAAVMVLGDIGHSPRMQYHVASLAKLGFEVDFIGFRGKLCCILTIRIVLYVFSASDSEPRADVLRNPAVDIVELKDSPAFLRRKFQFYDFREAA